MSGLFGGTGLVDVILALVVVEVAALVWFRRRTGRGPEPLGLLATAAAGGCLLLALRAALADADPIWIAAALAGAGLAHLADLARRWR